MQGAGTDSPLYMRIDGRDHDSGVRVASSGRTPDAQPAQPVGMSADGSIVYFTSGSFLTNADQGGLYRLDIDTNVLTLVTPLRSDDVLGVASVSGQAVSEDGGTVVFLSQNDLTGGHPTELFGPTAFNLYMHRGGQLRWIATVPYGEGVAREGNNGILSPSGRYYAFPSSGQLNGYDNIDAKCVGDFGAPDPNACTEVYVWDGAEASRSCASCGAGDRRSARFASVSPTTSRYVSRSTLDDGTVLFSTPMALVPQDGNGKSDVYAWKAGVVALISSGAGNADALFQDATLMAGACTSRPPAGWLESTPIRMSICRRGGRRRDRRESPPPTADAAVLGGGLSGSALPGQACCHPSIGSIDFGGAGDTPAALASRVS